MTLEERDLEAIRGAATRFRAAVEATDFDDLNFNLSRFPNDGCHHATALLRLYLFDRGLGLFDKAEGRRPCGREHVGLRRDDVVIDITADQFDLGQAQVIVTRESPWHAAWELSPSKPTDWQMIERSREFHAGQYPVYPRILANLGSSRD